MRLRVGQHTASAKKQSRASCALRLFLVISLIGRATRGKAHSTGGSIEAAKENDFKD
ncbi:MAG: hypothetical protein AB7U97_28705 [Pirellulales bacterium]